MSRDHLVLFAILFQYHVCYGPFRTHTLARTLRCNQCVVNLSLCISFPIEFFSLADVERTTWIFNRYEQAFNWNFRLLYLSTGINLVIFSVCFCVFLGLFFTQFYWHSHTIVLWAIRSKHFSFHWIVDWNISGIFSVVNKDVSYTVLLVSFYFRNDPVNVLGEPFEPLLDIVKFVYLKHFSK